MEPHATYSTLRVVRQTGIVRVTLSNPPVNALSARMMLELRDLLDCLRSDESVRVIVFDSADPEFFIAHVDMNIVEAPDELQRLVDASPPGLNPFQTVGELLRHQPQVTIVELAGFARGGGAEFVAAADMAFASIERAALGQIEAVMGVIPAGGGTQYLDRRLGRHRALEVVLGGALFDARSAERYGWVNRALPDEELAGFVDRLARHIATLPEGIVAAVKHALAPEDLDAGFLREQHAWQSQIERPAVLQLMTDGLAAGAQTREGERRLEDLYDEMTARRTTPVDQNG